MAKKRKTRKVGSSYTAMRTINGKRKKCRVTKKSKDRYSVHVIGAKRKTRKTKRKSTDYKYRSQEPWEITRKRKTKAKKHSSQKRVPRRRKTAKRKTRK